MCKSTVDTSTMQCQCDKGIPPVDSLVSDSDRLDWLQKIMIPRELYVEISFAGLRNGNADATAFQIEANPERFKVLNAPTLREAIDLAMKMYR